MEGSGPWPTPTLTKAPSPAGEELAAWPPPIPTSFLSHILHLCLHELPPLIYSIPVSKRATTALGWEAHPGITIFFTAL